MKALSVHQPYAWLIVHGHKPVENRGWATPYRGRLAIHAGLTTWVDSDTIAGIMARLCELQPDAAQAVAASFWRALASGFPTGALVGEVDLVDIVRDSASPWAVPGQHPIPYRGQRGLFEVTP